MKVMKNLILLLPISLLVACGKSKPPMTIQELNQNEVVTPDGSNIQGLYAADLWPINFNLNFSRVGVAGISRDGDNFEAMVKLKYGPKGIKHSQAIYTGRRCPTLQDDLNKDAYIDMQEALMAIGRVTIPLDADLSSQKSGYGIFPIGNANNGRYFYQETTSFEKMFSDLKNEDLDTEDQFEKIPENNGLTFPGRVILIQGATEKGTLPETIAAPTGEGIRESMPIACGILWKVKSLPEDLKEE
ncbi:MAG: hypothetical protein AB7I27_02255 [Bacteriovoracaceae bacterium]